MKNITSKAMPSERITPTLEWISRMLYDSPKMPEKMEPAAMPLVTVEEMPAMSKANAKTTAAAFPNYGVSKDCACWSSSTEVHVWKNVAAAKRINALFIAKPINIESNVS